MKSNESSLHNLWALIVLLVGMLLFAVFAAWKRHDTLIEEQRAAFQPIAPSSSFASQGSAIDPALLKADTSAIFENR